MKLFILLIFKFLCLYLTLHFILQTGLILHDKPPYRCWWKMLQQQLKPNGCEGIGEAPIVHQLGTFPASVNVQPLVLLHSLIHISGYPNLKGTIAALQDIHTAFIIGKVNLSHHKKSVNGANLVRSQIIAVPNQQKLSPYLQLAAQVVCTTKQSVVIFVRFVTKVWQKDV